MAELVGGFLMPHIPALPLPRGVFGEDPEAAGAVDEAFEQVARRIKELEADTVIIIGDDHYECFGPQCIPSCLIVTGDVELSAHAKVLGMEGSIPNNEPLAMHILQSGFDEGIDWSFAKSLGVDHSVGVPYHMVLKRYPDIKAIPVYLNDVVMPVIRSTRAYEIGQSIGRAVQSWSGNERVVIFGTGGISHWVGSPGMETVNSDFDRRILGMVDAGEIDKLITLSDEEILTEAGNGALEIKNWICALGAFPDARASSFAYQPVPKWLTGCGFAEIKVAA